MHNGRVEIDAEVLLLDDAGVPRINALLDPVGELIRHGGVDDVGQPLLWKLVPVQLIGEILEALRVLGNELLNLLDTQVLVLWDG